MPVLVVERNPFLGRLFCAELESAGHSTVRAETWAEALQAAAVVPPSVALVDATLAPKDGARFVRDLRTLPGLARTPVVRIACAHWAERDMLEAGAQCCIRSFPAKGDILKAVDWALSVYSARQGS